MKLRVKALLLFIGVGVLVVIAVGTFQFFNLREEKLQTIGFEVSRQVEHVDHALRWFLEEVERDLLGLAADQRVRSRNDHDFTNFLNADEGGFEYHIGVLESEIIEILNAFRVNHPHVNSVYMGRENGSFIRSHKRPRPTRYDPRTRPWYVLAKDNPGVVMRTTPYRSVTSPDVNIGLVTALSDANGTVYGVLGADITLVNLTKYIATYQVSHGGVMLLIDGDGTILAARMQELLFKNVREIFPSVLDLLNNVDQDGLVVDTPMGQQYAYVHISPQLDWRIVAMVPVARVRAEINQAVAVIVFASSAGIVLLSICTLVGLYRYVIGPIGRLTESARYVRQSGDLSRSFRIDSKDEIGELAEAGNDMLAALSTTVQKLKESRAELQQQKDLLEDRVRERTLDLEAANQDLVNEIAEREQAEAAVRNSRQRLAQIIDFLPDATFVIDRDGVVTAWNQAMEKLTGVPAQQMIGKGDHEYALPLYGDRRCGLVDLVMNWDVQIADGYRDVKRDGDAAYAEIHFSSLRGRERYLWVAACRFYDESGEIVGAIESMREITEWRAAVEAIKESESKYRVLIENAKEAIMVAQDRYWQFVNPRAEQMFGFPRTELTSRPLEDFIHPDDRQMLMDRHVRRLRGENPPDEYIIRIIDAASKTRWVDIKVVRIEWEGGPAALCLLTDITERVIAQREIEIQKAYLEQLFETAPEAILQIDADDRVVRVNNEFLNLFGYAADHVLGKPLDAIVIPDREPEGIRLLLGRLEKGEKSFHETVCRTKNGNLVDVSISGTSIRIDGEKAGVFVICQDIRQHKLAEENLRQAKEAAEAADRLKSAFLATMSHELRTPLNSIIGFTGIILQGLAGPLNAEQSKQLEMVRGSARHLLALINDVLDISKIEAGQLEVGCEPFDLRAAVESTVATVMPMADKKGLTMLVHVDPELGEVASDRRRVEQVVINLLNNAIKFTDSGSVTLTAEMVSDFVPSTPDTPDLSPQDAVRIRVADTGIGIKPEDMRNLFQPFRQIDTGLTRQHEGTGLGLAICRRLAQLLGAEIEAESQWGKGSVFTFTLPRKGALRS